MLNTDEALREKINDFLRRKEAKFPDLGSPLSREDIQKDTYKPSLHHMHTWASGTR